VCHTPNTIILGRVDDRLTIAGAEQAEALADEREVVVQAAAESCQHPAEVGRVRGSPPGEGAIASPSAAARRAPRHRTHQPDLRGLDDRDRVPSPSVTMLTCPLRATQRRRPRIATGKLAVAGLCPARTSAARSLAGRVSRRKRRPSRAPGGADDRPAVASDTTSGRRPPPPSAAFPDRLHGPRALFGAARTVTSSRTSVTGTNAGRQALPAARRRKRSGRASPTSSVVVTNRETAQALRSITLCA